MGQSPYDLYERVARSASLAQAQLRLRFDQVTIEYPPLALALMLAPLAWMPDDAGLGVHGKTRLCRELGAQFSVAYFVADVATVIGLASGCDDVGRLAVGARYRDSGRDRIGQSALRPARSMGGTGPPGRLGGAGGGPQVCRPSSSRRSREPERCSPPLLPLFLFGALPSTVRLVGSRKGARSELGSCLRDVCGRRARPLCAVSSRLGSQGLGLSCLSQPAWLQIESTWSSILLGLLASATRCKSCMRSALAASWELRRDFSPQHR